MTTLLNNTSPCVSFATSLFGYLQGTEMTVPKTLTWLPFHTVNTRKVLSEREITLYKGMKALGAQRSTQWQRHTDRAQTTGDLPEPINKTTRFFNK